MNAQQNEFFEEYKSLDKLCQELFHSNAGVSSYIEEMQRSSQGYRLVPSWNATLEMLKHIRWLRNQIAHGDSENVECSYQDIANVREFHEKILNRTDPLAIERQQTDCAKASKGVSYESARRPEYVYQAKRQEEIASRVLKVFGVICIIVIGIIVIVAILGLAEF